MLKSKNGITLIALIITIVILLILAGVTINMVLGDNGLFNKAKTSVAKYENAQEKENISFIEFEESIKKQKNLSGTVTVKFDANGGSNLTETTRELVAEQEYGNLPTLTPPEGKTFVGWYTQKENGERVTASTIANEDKTLYAQYSTTVNNFEYTGSVQTYKTPNANVTYKMECWGAQGGITSNKNKAGYTSGNIKIDSSIELYLYIGEKGDNVRTQKFNGGGIGGKSNKGATGSSGGGATDIRLITGNWDDFNSLKTRIMVAAGSGGGAESTTYETAGGYSIAGGLEGYQGGYYSGHSYVRQNGYGGTQTNGGSAGVNHFSASGTTESGKFGKGGNSDNASDSVGSGGGGGGYFGGGAGGGTLSQGCGQGAGGGSSFISGHNGCIAIDYNQTTSQGNIVQLTTGDKSVFSLNGKEYKFSDTVMIDGAGYAWTNLRGSLQAMPNPSGGNYSSGVGHSGNGYARITILSADINN